MTLPLFLISGNFPCGLHVSTLNPKRFKPGSNEIFKSRFIKFSKTNTVEPLLTATSLQQPLFSADSPYIDSCLNPSTKASFLSSRWLLCRVSTVVHAKIMPDRFHLNGHIKGFGSQPQTLAKPYDTSWFTLSYKQDSTPRSVFSRNVIPLYP